MRNCERFAACPCAGRLSGLGRVARSPGPNPVSEHLHRRARRRVLPAGRARWRISCPGTCRVSSSPRSPRPASVENARLVGNGFSDMGMVLGSVAYNARHGLPPFEQPLDIVALFQMYPAPQHIVTLKESGITSRAPSCGAAACRPKRRAAVPKPSRWPFLDVYGIDPGPGLHPGAAVAERVRRSAGGPGRGRRLPELCVSRRGRGADGHGARDIDLISLEQDMLQRIIEKYPYFVRTVIPAGTYRGVDYDCRGLGRLQRSSWPTLPCPTTWLTRS